MSSAPRKNCKNIYNTSRVVTRSETISAFVEWIADDSAVVGFDHPQLGPVHREFKLGVLPTGAVEGDSFFLCLGLSRSGEIISYQVLKDGPLLKRVHAEWETIPRPVPPSDRNDTEAAERYRHELIHYLKKIIPQQRHHEGPDLS